MRPLQTQIPKDRRRRSAAARRWKAALPLSRPPRVSQLSAAARGGPVVTVINHALCEVDKLAILHAAQIEIFLCGAQGLLLHPADSSLKIRSRWLRSCGCTCYQGPDTLTGRTPASDRIGVPQINLKKNDLVNDCSQDTLRLSAFSLHDSAQICEQSHAYGVGRKRRNGWGFAQDCGGLAFLKQVAPKAPCRGQLWSGSPGVRTSFRHGVPVTRKESLRTDGPFRLDLRFR